MLSLFCDISVALWLFISNSNHISISTGQNVLQTASANRSQVVKVQGEKIKHIHLQSQLDLNIAQMTTLRATIF